MKPVLQISTKTHGIAREPARARRRCAPSAVNAPWRGSPAAPSAGSRPSTRWSARPTTQISHGAPELRCRSGRTACRRYSRNGIAIICTTVFTLPSMCTATLRDAPICAIHSRSAEIAISRPMMTSATKRVSALQVHQHQQRRADQELVGHRIEEGAERRGLVELARQVAVDPVGQREDDEQHRARRGSASRPASGR